MDALRCVYIAPERTDERELCFRARPSAVVVHFYSDLFKWRNHSGDIAVYLFFNAHQSTEMVYLYSAPERLFSFGACFGVGLFV